MNKKFLWYVMTGLIAMVFLETTVAAATYTYQYDDLQRLVSVAKSDGTVSIIYNYDAAGNRTSKVVTATATPDTIKPVVTNFTAPSSATSLTVAGISITATDAGGVIGYLLTEEATAPLSNAAGWNASVTQYTFTTSGSKTLYAWAKDTAGNVSSAFTPVSINITVADTTPPSINTYSAPTTSTSLTVAGISVTASDNVGVTGYLLTELATKPLANSAGWSSSAPTTYTFSSAGARTLYAWAKDAAGNVSDLFAPVTTTITLLQPSVLFSDDFNDNTIDVTKWIVTRGDSRVAEEDGILKLEQNVTDAGGYIKSTMIPFDKTAAISFKRKVLVHAGNEFTYHSLVAYLNSDTTPIFNVSYLNTYWYDGDYQSMTLNGIYVTSASGVRTMLSNPIWDNWFDEEIIYDPVSGQLDYKVNNALVNSVNVGAMPASTENRIFLGISPYGWDTGHYHYTDDLEVSQIAKNGVCGLAHGSQFPAKPVTDLCAIGTASAVNGYGPWTWTCSVAGTAAACSAQYTTVLNVSSSDVPKYIDDYTSVSSGLPVPQGSCSAVKDINVAMNVTHTYVGDLIVSLTHTASGKTAAVLYNQCGGSSGIVATMDDEASTSVQCPPNGTYIPFEPLTVFDGINPSGLWTLTVNDSASGDTGFLNSWSLSIECASLPTHSLEVVMAGAGGGNINSDPSGITCPGGTCSKIFDTGTPVTLMPTADDISTFGGWSGACTNSSGNCEVVMDADKIATATFLSTPKAKTAIKGYPTLNAAYSDAADGSTIFAIDSDFVENLTANLGKNMKIIGGYKADYSAKSGLPSILNGLLTIVSGSITIDGVVIK